MAASNITFIEGESFCRWHNKLVDSEECLKLFGVENPEIRYENKKLVVIGSTLFCDNTKDLIDKIQEADELANIQWIMDISEVKRMYDLKFIDMKAIKLFNKDLDDYYANLIETSRNIPFNDRS